MEWGLRKVLPKLTESKKSAFIRHIFPVIAELCGQALTDEELAELLKVIQKASRPADTQKPTDAEKPADAEGPADSEG